MRILNGRLLAGVAAIALGGLALPGAASADQKFGSAGILTNRACPPAATNCIGPKVEQLAGGMGMGFSTSATFSGGATAAAAVSFGDGYLPIVKVGSASGAETRTGGSAVALRTFTYEGDAAIDLALNGQLHFVSSGDPVANQEDAGDGIFYVSLGLLPVAAIAGYGPGMTPAQLVGDTAVNFPECGGPSGVIAVSTYSGVGTSGDTNATIGLSQRCGGGAITINPGDQFVIIASLQAISNRNGFINAMNTFRVEYDLEKTVYTGTDETVGLAALRTSVNGAVPEPGTWALMILGFGGVSAMLRRRAVALRTR